MDQWYALVKDPQGGEQRLGPMPFAELVHLYEVGRLTEAGLVWQPGYPGWRSVSEVEGLTPFKPGPSRRAGAWPSDSLPLWILAGIVLCFIMHFTERRLVAAAKPAPAAPKVDLEAPGPGALVEVEICNRTDVARLYASVAYYDALQRDWVARGWYPVDRGSCLIPLKNLKPPVFVYAESKDGRDAFGDEDGGIEFCIDGETGFVFPQKGCAGRRATFRELKLRGDSDRVSWELSP